MCPCGVSQSILISILQSWGEEGWQDHIKKVRDYYRSQRDLAISAAAKYLTGLAEWNIPTGGMFMWIRPFGIQDSKSLVLNHCVNNGILFLFGETFLPNGEKSPYIRASFSTAQEKDFEEAFRILAKILQQFSSRSAL